MGPIVSILQIVARIVLAGHYLLKRYLKVKSRNDINEIKEVLNEVEEKQNDGTLSDDDIRTANRKLFEHKKGILP